MLVTRFGVSVLNVVATIEMPTSHHGAARPDVKNSVVLEPARFAKKIAGRNEIAMLAAMMVQSSVVNCIRSGAVGGQTVTRMDANSPRVKSGNLIGFDPFASDIWD